MLWVYASLHDFLKDFLSEHFSDPPRQNSHTHLSTGLEILNPLKERHCVVHLYNLDANTVSGT